MGDSAENWQLDLGSETVKQNNQTISDTESLF